METLACMSLIMHSIIVMFIFITIIMYKPHEYVHVGPHKNLTLINIKIDTLDIYLTTIITLSLLRFTHLSITRIGELYMDSLKYEHQPQSVIINVCFISNVLNYVKTLSFLILIKAYVTQFDFAVIPIVVSEVLFLPVNYYFLAHNNNKKKEQPSEILDLTTMNPLFTPKLKFDQIYADE